MELRDLGNIKIGNYLLNEIHCKELEITLVNKKVKEVDCNVGFTMPRPFIHHNLDAVISILVKEYLRKLINFIAKEGLLLQNEKQTEVQLMKKIENLRTEIKIIKEGLPLFKNYYFIINSNELHLPDDTFKIENWTDKSNLLHNLNDNNFCQIKIKIQNGKSFKAFVNKNLV